MKWYVLDIGIGGLEAVGTGNVPIRFIGWLGWGLYRFWTLPSMFAGHCRFRLHGRCHWSWCLGQNARKLYVIVCQCDVAPGFSVQDVITSGILVLLTCMKGSQKTLLSVIVKCRCYYIFDGESERGMAWSRRNPRGNSRGGMGDMSPITSRCSRWKAIQSSRCFEKHRACCMNPHLE